MNKITPAHTSRSAYVYVRQSTADQLANNLESRRRQYGLEPRARALGFSNVEVIDDDLGRSGGGAARPGFERLLSAICTGQAGAVFAIEASRLARNGRDWHTLLEFCALVDCLIIDEDGAYDPKQINDRLLLGMKGTFSELELSILRQRSQEALRLKAARGDLHTMVAIGYVRSADDRLEMDPDQRICDALRLAFKKFEEFGSARQVSLWLTDEGVVFPVTVHGAQGRRVEWRLPRYNTIHRLLTNPVYAGAYAFGRTGSQNSVTAGRRLVKRGIRRTQETWEVLIREHHEGYISWEEYERNQRMIAGNANMKGAMVKGSVRNGGGLLAGLLRCGRCGRKLKVLHNGARGVARYVCNDASVNHGRRTSCIAFGNMRIDAAVSVELLRIVAPLGLEAALAVISGREQVGDEVVRQKALALEQARYEATRAQRQYDAVDPENRLVASSLEQRWNHRLVELARLEEEVRNLEETRPPALTETERAEILAMGSELSIVWDHPAASPSIRKRILRAALEEIVVTVETGELRLAMHWKGGDHTTITVPKNRSGQHRWKTKAATEDLIRDLARLTPDSSIASILNRLGVRTAKNHTWTEQRVRTFRSDRAIAVYRHGERAERGEVNLEEAAALLGVSKMTVTRLIKDAILPARQSCTGAPYVISKEDIDLPVVQRAIKNGRAVSQDPRQGSFKYQ